MRAFPREPRAHRAHIVAAPSMAVGERTAMLWLEQFIAMTLDALQLHPQEGSMFRVTYHILEERDEEESWMKDGYEEDEEEDAAEEEEAAGVDAMDVDE